MAEEKNKEVKKAVKVLDEMSMSKKERERYEAIQKYEFNYNTSMYNMKEEGKKKGRNEEKVEIAKQLYKMGIDINKISKATGLSLENLKQILS